VRQWQDRQDEVPTDTSGLPVIGETVLGDQKVEMHQFSNLVPMRDLTTGDLDEMALLAGQGVGLVNTVGPAGRAVAEITAQARVMLDRYRSMS